MTIILHCKAESDEEDLSLKEGAVSNEFLNINFFSIKLVSMIKVVFIPCPLFFILPLEILVSLIQVPDITCHLQVFIISKGRVRLAQLRANSPIF